MPSTTIPMGPSHFPRRHLLSWRTTAGVDKVAAGHRDLEMGVQPRRAGQEPSEAPPAAGQGQLSGNSPKIPPGKRASAFAGASSSSPLQLLPGPVTTTSFLLSNLHCPTCVSSIKTALQMPDAGRGALSAHIRWVSPNEATSVVTVEHTAAASVGDVRIALEDAGFELCRVATTSTGGAAGEGAWIDVAAGSAPAGGAKGKGRVKIPSIIARRHKKDSDRKEGIGTSSTVFGVPRAVSADSEKSRLEQVHLRNCELCRTGGVASPVIGAQPLPLESGEGCEQRMSEDDEEASYGMQRQLSGLALSALAGSASPRISQDDGWSQTMTEVNQSVLNFVSARSYADDGKQQRWRVTLAIGGMTCSACSTAIRRELDELSWVSDVTVSHMTNGASLTILGASARAAEVAGIVEGMGYEATVDSVVDLDEEEMSGKKAGRRSRRGIRWRSKDAIGNEEGEDIWRATLAIGGMTCAACVNAITEALREKTWVINVNVNLLSNSATVEFKGEENAEKLVKEIGSIGYEGTIDSVVRVDAHHDADKGDGTDDEDDGEEGPQPRTVEVLISGLYCDRCPLRIVSSLGGFHGSRYHLDILTPPTRQRPIIKIAYTPDPEGGFTIRRILAAIAATDEGIGATIHHPPTLEERSRLMQRRHQRQLLLRILGTLLVAIPTFIIGVVFMSLVPRDNPARQFLTKPWTSGISRAQVAMFIMATPVFFFAADQFHSRALKEVRALWRRGSRVPLLRRFYRFGSMNTLISLGTTIAYVSSVAQMIAAAVHKPAEVSDSYFYFDSVVFLTLFLLLGKLIESYSKSRTGDAVEMLGKLRPVTATLVEREGTEKEQDMAISVDLLDYGDIVRVSQGASPPADGILVRGQTKFDESSLTGESRPVSKGPGDPVFAGTVNRDAAVLVRVTGTAGHSMLDQIVRVVREGQTRRAPVEHIADTLTTYFVPFITLVAIVTWVVWMSLGLSGRLPNEWLGDVTSGGWVTFSLQFAIAVFVVACPCGLALAAPTAIFVGGGIAAQHGILAKGGGEAFEKASRVRCVVFDKTGTLTNGGEPTVADWEMGPWARGGVPKVHKKVTFADDETDTGIVLGFLQAIEENSSHPVAKAIVAFCAARTLPKARIGQVQEIPGRGMKATCRQAVAIGKKEGPSFSEMLVGNEELLSEFFVSIPPHVALKLQQWKRDAKSVALVAVKQEPPSSPDGAWKLAAAFCIADSIRPEATGVIKALEARGTRVWMLSGDNVETAAAVARQLGIPADQVIAGVLPTEKAAKVQYLQRTVRARVRRWGFPWCGRRREAGEWATQRALVAMVGDGINDSPALATADVGIAVGSGSDIAIGSAGFVLVKSDLRAVLTLLDLSAAVFGRVKLNFMWALVYNCIAVPVAAGALYAVRGSGGQHVRLDPVWASLAMALSSISVILSSLALRLPVRVLGFRERRVELDGS